MKTSISYSWWAHSTLSHKHLTWKSKPSEEGGMDGVILCDREEIMDWWRCGPSMGAEKMEPEGTSKLWSGRDSLCGFVPFAHRAGLVNWMEVRLKTDFSNTSAPPHSVCHEANPSDSGQPLRGATALWLALESVARSLAGEDTSCSLQKRYWPTECISRPCPTLCSSQKWGGRVNLKKDICSQIPFYFQDHFKVLWLGHAFFLLPKRLHHFQFFKNPLKIQADPLLIIVDALRRVTVISNILFRCSEVLPEIKFSEVAEGRWSSIQINLGTTVLLHHKEQLGSIQAAD